jgi:cAMP-dependent protein kinase regulator
VSVYAAAVRGRRLTALCRPRESSEVQGSRASADEIRRSDKSQSSVNLREDAVMDDEQLMAMRKRTRAAKQHGRRAGVFSEPVELDASFEPRVIPKSDDSRVEIAAAIAHNIVFAGLADDQRQVLIDAMERTEFAPGSVIIRQGDPGDNFYVQASGLCHVLVNGKVVLETKEGDSFGELALLYDSPRAATVQVVGDSPVVAWAIDRVTFKQVVVATTIAKRKRYASVLDRVPLMRVLPDMERSAVLDALLPRTVAAGDIVLSQGATNTNRFFLVEDGELKAVSDASDEVSPVRQCGPCRPRRVWPERCAPACEGVTTLARGRSCSTNPELPL